MVGAGDWLLRENLLPLEVTSEIMASLKSQEHIVSMSEGKSNVHNFLLSVTEYRKGSSIG
uniref:Uncharacterized protein n=1 Tax=Oryza meridionalis TaxID=40149 RepID=A0A0E0FEQ1_9ORYZ